MWTVILVQGSMSNVYPIWTYHICDDVLGRLFTYMLEQERKSTKNECFYDELLKSIEVSEIVLCVSRVFSYVD